MTSTILASTAIVDRVRAWAQELGFDTVGIAPVAESAYGEAYQRWIEAGFAGEMAYLARPDAVEKRADPRVLVPGARTAIVVTRNYYPVTETIEEDIGADRGVFARYARNEDYHEPLKARLIELQDRIAEQVESLGGRAYVDTGAVLERELAERAGLGWYGRNTMLIQPGRGSYYFLGVILVDIDLPCDEPFERDHCGTCERCITACPTGALLGRDEAGAPVMDARRCISYLTIELRGPIPRGLRPLIGNRIYGCDICQEVCPHNSSKFVQITPEEAFWPREGVHGARLIDLMGMDQEEFSRRFRKSPVKRAKRRGLLRNVAVALGNWGSVEAVPVLVAALEDDEPLVRGHAAWALGRISARSDAPPEVVRACAVRLEERLQSEEDAWVRDELSIALKEIAGKWGGRI